MNEATLRAGRAARGQSGTWRVGFTESASWHGVVPGSFRQFRQQQPDAELQLNPSSSSEQIEAIRSAPLDAGFVFNMPRTDPELEQLQVASHNIALAAPKRHPLEKLRKPRLRDLGDTPFVWFPRRESPAFYDRLMHECFRAGLKSPRIVQEGVNEATILSLVLHGVEICRGCAAVARSGRICQTMRFGGWIRLLFAKAKLTTSPISREPGAVSCRK